MIKWAIIGFIFSVLSNIAGTILLVIWLIHPLTATVYIVYSFILYLISTGLYVLSYKNLGGK